MIKFFINNKNCNYKPWKSFITQYHLLFFFEKKNHREKVCNTGKTQGKHREFYLGWNVATLYKAKNCLEWSKYNFFVTKIIVDKKNVLTNIF